MPIDHRMHRGQGGSHKRNGRPIPHAANLAISQTAQEVPPPPADLGATGHAFWERIWSSSGWISPVGDYAIVAETARLIDIQEIARCRATRTGNPRDRRVVLAMSRELSSALAGLGFNPQDRANLGVGLSAPRRSRSRRTG
jgi:hypothetical protein